jgi:glucose-6-phosphate 1-dehydrogenase
VPVIGIALSSWNDEQLREYARSAVAEHLDNPDQSALVELTRALTYLRGDYREQLVFQELKEHVTESQHPLFYLAIPPSMFETVVGASAVLA